MGAKLTERLTSLGRLVRKAGPYVVLEVVMPGGTLMALLLYLYRTGQLPTVDRVRAASRAVFRSAGRSFDQMALAWQPPGAAFAGHGARNDRDGLEPLNLLQARR